MNIVQEFIAKFKDFFKHDQMESEKRRPRERPSAEDHLMTEDEKLDERLKETFPASDPPGHILKSEEDLRQY